MMNTVRFRLNESHDELTPRVRPLIEIERSDDRFKRARQEWCAGASAGGFLAPRHEHVRGHAEGGRQSCQRLAFDERGAQRGELALAHLREMLV